MTDWPDDSKDRERRLRNAIGELRARVGASVEHATEALLLEHPDLAADEEAAIDLIYAEYTLREQLGQNPSNEDYVGRFPRWKERIEKLLSLHSRLEDSIPQLARAALADAGSPVQHVGRFELLEEIGRGEMGVVYRARDCASGQLVGLKLMLAAAFAGPEDLRRLREGAIAAAGLQHPNIVRLYECGEAGGIPYLVLELVDGRPLSACLADFAESAGRCAELAAVLARSIDFAHRAGVVHRDLKPANILIAADGTPKIADFGLAKLLDDSSGPSRSATIVGTPAYMAPEVVAGRSKDVGPAVDVYALGVILYELLTGRRPFDGSSLLSVLHRVLSEEPELPSRVRRGLSTDIETVCLTCLQKDPAHRYATADSLADDLDRFLRGEPILARRPTLADKAARWAVRNPRVLVGTLGVMTVAIASLSVASLRISAERRAAVKAKSIAIEQRAIAVSERSEAVKHRDQANRLSAEMMLDRGLIAFDQGDVGAGMLWLARSLQTLPAQSPVIEHVIRVNLAAWHPHLASCRAILSEQGRVEVVAFSPESTALMTGHSQGQNHYRLNFWDTAASNLTGSLPNDNRDLNMGLPAPFFNGHTVLVEGTSGYQLWSPRTRRTVGPNIPGASGFSFNKGPLRYTHMLISSAPDGRTIVLTSSGGQLRRIDALKGTLIGPTLEAQPERVGIYYTALAISHDGKTIAGSSAQLGRVAFWRSNTGKLVATADLPSHWSEISCLAFSPDDRLLAAATEAPGTIEILDASTAKHIRTELTGGGRIEALTFSPEGECLWTAQLDGKVQRWKCSTWQPIGPPVLAQSRNSCVRISPNAALLATGGGDGTTRLWSLPAMSPEGRRPLVPERGFPGDALFVRAMAPAPDGKSLLLLDQYCAVWSWELMTGAPPTPRFKTDFDPLATFIAFDQHPSLPIVMIRTAKQSRQTVSVYNSMTGRLLGRYPIGLPDLEHDSASLSADGETFVSRAETGPERKAPRLETQTGRVVVVLKPRAEIDPELKAARFETYTGRMVSVLKDAKTALRAGPHNPIGTQLLMYTDNGGVQIQDVKTGDRVGTVAPPGDGVIAASWSLDGTRVATVSGQGLVRDFDVALNRNKSGFSINQDVADATFSANQKRVLVLGADGTTRIWDVAAGRPLGPSLTGPYPLGRGRLERRPGGIVLALGGKAAVIARAGDRGPAMWHLPEPIHGSPEKLAVWVQVVTCKELDESGNPRLLDLNEWNLRRQQLDKMGGPALP